MGAWSVGQTSAIAQVVNQPPPPPPATAVLFIGDVGDNTVKEFDSTNGNFIGTFVTKDAGLNGPMGMIFTDGHLLVVSQNIGQGRNQAAGEVFRFDGQSGMYISKLFSSTDLNAAYARQGIVRGVPNNRIYVADIGTQGNKCNSDGNIKLYDDSGAFLGNLDRTGFKPGFYPRGIVFGGVRRKGRQSTLSRRTGGTQRPKSPFSTRLF
jgi:hypothetical protein